MIYIHNATIYTPVGKLDHGAILISGETITAIGLDEDLRYPANTQVVNANGQSLVPGFIDLQINGAFGLDFTSEPEMIWKVGESLTRFGVTSFLPTIISSPPETIRNARAVLHNGPPRGYHGARVIGLHLEGPYLNPEKCGAHNPANIRLPDPEEYHLWSPENSVRMVTIAPELPGALSAIETLVSHGAVVCAGHSQASFDQGKVGIEAGICYGTHLFNAMPPLDHRLPGLVGALLADERLTCGLIIDGIHLHPQMVKLAWQILGSQRINLVTDAEAAMGMPAGEYQLGEHTVFVNGPSASLADGTLAGSLLSLDQALRNFITFTGCSLEEAFPTVSQVPARLLRLDSSLGNLVVGAKADFVLMDPDLQVTGVWLNGQQIRSVSG